MIDTDGRPTCGESGGIAKSGKPCGNFMGLGPTGLCLMHDPDRADTFRELVASGGAKSSEVAAARKAYRRQHGAPPPPMKDVRTAKLWLSYVNEQLHRGLISDKVANAHERIARSFVIACEASDTKTKLRELERTVKEGKKARKLRAI